MLGMYDNTQSLTPKVEGGVLQGTPVSMKLL